MKKVIAVDDSKVAIIQVEKYVKRRLPDCEVLGFTNADEGLKALIDQRESLDGVIVDYNMKEMNGVEFIESAKKHGFDTQKVFVCTANLQKIIAEKVTNLGAQYIEKPLSQDKIDGFLSYFEKLAS